MARTFLPHLLVLCGIGLSTAGRAQAPVNCAVSGPLPGSGPGGDFNCRPEAPLTILWDEFKKELLPHVPGTGRFNPSGAVKTVRVAVHVWSDGEPLLSYLPSQANHDSIARILALIEEKHWIDLDPPSDPVPSFLANDTTCGSGSNWYACHPDTRLRMAVVGIYFHEDSAMWALDCSILDHRNQLSGRAVELEPACRGALNLHIIRVLCCSGAGAADQPTYVETAFTWQEHYTVTSCYRGENGAFDGDDVDFFVRHWAHEIGHILDLRHLYDGPDAFANEITNSDAFDFLRDIFGANGQDPIPQTWCQTATAPNVCYFAGNGPVYQSSADAYINNVMANDDTARSTTPLQMGRMHRALMLAGPSRYAWGYDSIPYHIAPVTSGGNPVAFPKVFNFRAKMYQDLVVDSGTIVVVKCTLEFVPQARLIVKPGGTLVIDGGLIRAAEFADSTWRGVEVWGTDTAARTPWPNSGSYVRFLNQGSIEFKNGGRVENAETGILFGSRNEAGKGGGVLITDLNYPAILRNCATGIEYHPYTAAAGDALSAARHIRFERDSTALPAASGPYLLRHIKATDMHPLLVENCWFANQQPGIIGSLDLGQGITSINTSLTVRPACVVGPWPCATALQRPNLFTGLDHGVELFTTTGNAYATITHNTFTNNIAGVYANGMAGFAVVKNSFTVGNNNVVLNNVGEDLWGGYHRAIYSYDSYGFTIRDNLLMKDSLAPAQSAEGIVIGYSRDHNDIVQRNVGHGLDRAFVGEGICAEAYNGLHRMIGLQFFCNENDSNAVNFWSRLIQAAVPEEQDKHTIRVLQGHRRRAANIFDRWSLSTPDTWDFHVTTTFRPLRYYYDGLTTPLEQLPVSFDEDLFNLSLNSGLPSSASGCRPVIPEDGTNMTTEELKQFMLDERHAYGETRYLHDALIDGGSTDEVVQEITSAWPEEAWELRTYLLGLSPNLSVEALKAAVNKTYFPMAMKAEVCIANPDATKEENFIKWLEEEALEPMPAYLIDLIKASWETQTYRGDLELEMGDRHAAMTQAGNELLLRMYQADTLPPPADARWVWQQIRTTAARYAEAMSYLAGRNFTQATIVVESIPTDHELKDEQWHEQQRMLDYIELLKTAALAGRNERELLPGEVSELVALRDAAHDRASNWINNLLCLYYNDCLAPLSGGQMGDPKILRLRSSPTTSETGGLFLTAPNPAQAWVTFTYRIKAPYTSGTVRVQDALGRTMLTLPFSGSDGQLVQDIRTWSPGLFQVQYVVDGNIVRSDKLIVQ